MHKIFKLCGSPSEEYWKKSKLPHATSFKPQHPYKRCVTDTFKDFPPSVLALVDILLSIEPEKRGTASSALNSEVIKLCSLNSNTSLVSFPFEWQISSTVIRQLRVFLSFAYNGHSDSLYHDWKLFLPHAHLSKYDYIITFSSILWTFRKFYLMIIFALESI